MQPFALMGETISGFVPINAGTLRAPFKIVLTEMYISRRFDSQSGQSYRQLGGLRGTSTQVMKDFIIKKLNIWR
jgi:hypothetical protein